MSDHAGCFALWFYTIQLVFTYEAFNIHLISNCLTIFNYKVIYFSKH